MVELFEFLSPAPRAGDPERPVCDHGITHICFDVRDLDADVEGGKSIQLPVQPGTTLFVPKGNREVAVNRSGVRYHEILIELK